MNDRQAMQIAPWSMNVDGEKALWKGGECVMTGVSWLHGSYLRRLRATYLALSHTLHLSHGHQVSLSTLTGIEYNDSMLCGVVAWAYIEHGRQQHEPRDKCDTDGVGEGAF